MICDVSIEGIQKRLNEKNEKVSQDYKVLDIKCKGEQPSLMPINKNTTSQRENREQTKLYHEIMDIKKNATKEELDK